MTNIGAKLKETRKRKGLSQEELAEEAKVNLRTIQRIESCESEPRGKTLHLICTALGVQAEEILDYGRQEDSAYLAMVHASVLVFLLIPLGNIILPLILWTNKKDRILGLQALGANLLNYQILWSILAYSAISAYALLKILHWEGQAWFLYSFAGLYVLNIILPVYFAVQLKKGKNTVSYPTFIHFISS